MTNYHQVPLRTTPNYTDHSTAKLSLDKALRVTLPNVGDDFANLLREGHQ